MSTVSCDEKNSCQSCEQSEKCSQDEKQAHEQKVLDERMSCVKLKFMVISGKGGVGKSMVASLMAVVLKRQGY